MKIYSLYQITNIINNNFYIGITAYPERRMAGHKSYAKRNKSGLLYKEMRNYGIENFVMNIIYQSLDSVHIAVTEQQFIKELKPKLNLRSGGTGSKYRIYDNKFKLENNNVPVYYSDNISDDILKNVFGNLDNHFQKIILEVVKKDLTYY